MMCYCNVLLMYALVNLSVLQGKPGLKDGRGERERVKERE